MGNEAVYLGRGLLHQATVTLTDAQIKGLGDGPNTATIVAAPGASKVLLLAYGYGMLDTAAGAYTLPDTTGWALLADNNAGVYLSGIVPMDTALTATAVTPIGFSPFYSAGGSPRVGDVGSDFARVLLSLPDASPINKPIVISDFWAGGAYTGGNAANTLNVSVAYYLFNTATGQFE